MERRINMTSKEMMRIDCGKNRHFENVAKLGEDPDWVIRDYPFESVDPNKETIFGHEVKSFMARQYK